MVKNIKMGKISLPMDVNSSNAVPAFEHMLTKGPMAVVLVYADWCGHCDKYKKNVWSPLKSVKNRTVNMASLREDMLPNTSLANAKIDGYPSILVVGKDKKPAIFNSNSGVTNALPESNDVSTMKSLVTAPVPKEATAANANASNASNAYSIANSAPLNSGTNISYPSLMASESMAANSANSTYTPLNNSAMNVTNSAMNVSNTGMKTSNTGMNVSNTGMKTSNTGMKASNSVMKTSNTGINVTNTGMKTSNTGMNVANNSTINFAKTATPTATNTVPPSIDEDTVELPSIDEAPRTSPANNQGTTPILRGGRLFRKLSVKYRKANNKTKKTKRNGRKH